MNFVIGFLIAVGVGLTGIGGGSFAVPALILIGGLPPNAAVGTAFLYTAVLRLFAAPWYVMSKDVNFRYLRPLLQGAIPGLLIGTLVLQLLSKQARSPLVVIILGVVLAVCSTVTFSRRMQNHRFVETNARWLCWWALPIGVEAGFSSAGAGALGTVLLMNYSTMSPSQVVGTDILFGLVLAFIGSAFHLKFGAINAPILWQLLSGGLPGVLLGCAFARRVPARRLKVIIALIALLAGLQLVWNGTRTLRTDHNQRAVGITSTKNVNIVSGK